jgi:hypothetical protein
MGSPDGIEMDTGAVIGQTTALTGVADRLAAAWADTSAQVDGHRAGIGADLIGHVFHRVYDSDETQARELADGVAPKLHGSAQVAELSAYLYRAADQNGHNAMPSLPEGSNRGPR